jgi:hypothetical protein
VPIRQLASVLERELSLPVLVDEAALEAVNLDPAIPVRLIATRMSLQSALNRVLRPVGLTYTIRDEALVITTVEEAESDILTAVYPVCDLVRRSRLLHRPWDDEYDFDSLIQTVRCTVAPETWDQVGGYGTVQPFDKKRCLVVSQTMDVHEQIQSLLSRLRRAKKEQSIQTPARPDPTEVVRRIYDVSILNVEPQSLEELVVQLVEPDRWAGTASAYIKAIPGKLIVRQTRDVQQQIDKFLRELATPKVQRWMMGTRGASHSGGMGGFF